MSEEILTQEAPAEAEATERSGLGTPVENAPAFQETPEVFQSLVGTLPEEIRNTTLIQETKDFESLVGQAINAQKLLGRKTIEEPQEDWGDEQWDNFYKTIGRPEDAKEYGDAEFLQETYKEVLGETPLNAEEIENWNQVFHQAGLSPKQAQKLQEAYIRNTTEAMTGMKEQQNVQIAENTAALRQEWGDEYTANLNIANQAYDKLAPDGLKDLIDSNPVIANNQGFLKLFLTLGKEMGDARQRTGGQQNTFAPNSPAAADAELSRLEDTYKELIYPPGGVNALTMAQRTERDAILKKRSELYQMKFPSET
jgi:hypothetical protein